MSGHLKLTEERLQAAYDAIGKLPEGPQREVAERLIAVTETFVGWNIALRHDVVAAQDLVKLAADLVTTQRERCDELTQQLARVDEAVDRLEALVLTKN